MQKLTPRQAEVLSLIKRYLGDRGFPPTRAEITQELGFKSPNAVEEHLKALARKDAIEMTPGTSRGIRIPGFEPYAAGDGEDLPMTGRVATGAPILARQNIEESCRINPAFFSPRANCLLRVRGISIKDIDILDDGLLTVHVTRETHNGQAMVARVGKEVTVKHFKHEGNEVWLLVENPEFTSIGVDLKEQELITEGLSVGMIRR